ncbi:hypothetical protein [Bradyrhizobium roseum]|uniref:hypothetical protein n=1 Tax=Bradyrhizobium roseum TaxID=3056648 RepID=UPI0026262CDC|nr:hypothetical protein [Bradyrhizobium roseus]WKA27024.1 hypothetical protein QUH67_26110 [Bradyrhizobium roseus]
MSTRSAPTAPAVGTPFIESQSILPTFIRDLTSAALLSATLSIAALPGLVRAQSGNAGGQHRQ